MLIFRRFNFRGTLRRFCSNLKEEPEFRGLIPYVEIEDRFADDTKLREELRLRGSSVALEELISLWKKYKQLSDDIKAIDIRKKEVRAAATQGSETARVEGRQLREKGKALAKEFVAVERLAIPAALALPVPLATQSLGIPLSSNQRTEDVPADSSLEVGRRLGLVDWRDEWSYYLLGQAALYELTAPTWLSSKLARLGAILTSGADFAHPSLARAAPSSKLGCPILSNNLHLLGAASPATLAAPLARSVLSEDSLPVFWVTVGRSYMYPGGDWHGIQKAIQRHGAHALLVGSNETEVANVVNTIWEAFVSLGLDVRLKPVEPHDLLPWEAARVDIVGESPLNGRNIVLSSLSDLGEHTSRRLRTYVKPSSGGPLKFPRIYSGSILDIPSILGYILEHGDQKASEILDTHLNLFKSQPPLDT